MTDNPRRLLSTPSSVDLMVHTLTLAELLDGARDGLRSYIGELQRRFGPALLKRVASQDSTVTGDSILSDVFMRLPTALIGYQEEGKFEAWLWVIAKNVLRDRVRQRARAPEQYPHSDFDVAGGVRVEGAFERDDLVEKLTACLAPRQREVWMLNMAGFSDQDAAAQMGITANNVAQLLYRARTKLREEAQKMGLKPSDFASDRSQEFG